jgi:hypothetical protein
VTRVAFDLDGGAFVGDDAPALLDLAALGTYYGALFVRHAGAAWGTAEGEDGPELPVIRGAASQLPLTLVRVRVSNGTSLLFREHFARAAAEKRAGG